jgi:hypothetical protein
MLLWMFTCCALFVWLAYNEKWRHRPKNIFTPTQGCQMPDARWYISEPKIPIWVNFGGWCNGRCRYILWPFGLVYIQSFGAFYDHLVYFMVIWYAVPKQSGNPAPKAFASLRAALTVSRVKMNVTYKAGRWVIDRKLHLFTCALRNASTYPTGLPDGFFSKQIPIWLHFGGP